MKASAVRRKFGLVGSIALLWAGAAAAQEPVYDELPDSVALRVVGLHNAPGTTRFTGEVRIAAGTAITGAVAVVGGPVTVAGRVEGALVVINGELRFEAGAVVTEPVQVVGGSIQGETSAAQAGWVVYREPLRFRQDADGLIHRTAALPEGISAGRDFAFGRTDLFLAARTGYNRVEGLPIAFGPRFRLGNTNPTVLEGFAIYRTASGFDPQTDEMGYAIRLEQYVGGRRTVRIGARFVSEISPIERGLTDRENSLATFLLHRDYRDSYERDGWSAFLRWARPGGPHDVTLEYRNERHRSVAPGDPWSILDNDNAWRPNPIVAEGVLHSIVLTARYDSRNEELDPATGWDATVELEQGLGGGLDPPAFVEALQATAQPHDAFTAATIDLRRYIRLTPYSRMAIRALVSGSVDGDALPPQRQRALGGEGTLPGYRLMEFDCGARNERLDAGGTPFFPWYGCDRVMLVQLEYQAGFPFARRLGDAIGIGLDLGQQVRWAAFFDAGRAWNEIDALDGRGRGQSDFSADAGIGIRIGQLGLYWTLPLSGTGQGFNFFVRIGRRL